MLLDTYFYKLASQEKGLKTKSLAYASSKGYTEPKRDLMHKKHFPHMIFSYDNWDGNKGNSFEYSPRPSRRISMMLDEYFEKSANRRFTNKHYPTRQAV